MNGYYGLCLAGKSHAIAKLKKRSLTNNAPHLQARHITPGSSTSLGDPRDNELHMSKRPKISPSASSSAPETVLVRFSTRAYLMTFVFPFPVSCLDGVHVAPSIQFGEGSLFLPQRGGKSPKRYRLSGFDGYVGGCGIRRGEDSGGRWRKTRVLFLKRLGSAELLCRKITEW